MIYYVEGDPLLSTAQLLAHEVAAEDEFRTDVGLELRRQWPAMYKDFRHMCHTGGLSLGDIWTWAGPGARIVTLVTHEPAAGHHQHAGRATLAATNHALRKLRHFVDTESIGSLALPRLGAGPGGPAWSEVKGLIEHHFSDASCDVYVYEHHKTGSAAEEA